jgi:endonuclease IV
LDRLQKRVERRLHLRVSQLGCHRPYCLSLTKKRVCIGRSLHRLQDRVERLGRLRASQLGRHRRHRLSQSKQRG